jgi:hypothetical protein
MHAANSPVAITGCGPPHVKPGELHYYLQLPQVGGLLLKDCGGFLQKSYALFKRRFSKNAFIDSFGGGIR